MSGLFDNPTELLWRYIGSLLGAFGAMIVYAYNSVVQLNYIDIYDAGIALVFAHTMAFNILVAIELSKQIRPAKHKFAVTIMSLVLSTIIGLAIWQLMYGYHHRSGFTDDIVVHLYMAVAVSCGFVFGTWIRSLIRRILFTTALVYLPIITSYFACNYRIIDAILPFRGPKSAIVVGLWFAVALVLGGYAIEIHEMVTKRTEKRKNLIVESNS